MLITTNTTHAANEHLFKRLPYDPVKGFAPVTLLGKGGQIMIVNPKLPVKTVAEFVALAKKEPGKISCGSDSSSSRIAGELLQQMADIKLLHVAYKSNPQAVRRSRRTCRRSMKRASRVTRWATGSLPTSPRRRRRRW